MKFSFNIKIGQTEIEITEDAESHQDFVKKLSFFTTIPTAGPGGETDLRFVHRKTSGGHEYYSLISDLAGKEFKFGQSKREPGTLFCKGWEDKFQGDEQNGEQDDGQQSAPQGGIGQPLGNQASANPPANPPANGPKLPINQPTNKINAPASGPKLPLAGNAGTKAAPPKNNLAGNLGQQLNGIGGAPQNNAPKNSAPKTGPSNPAVNDVLAKYGIKQNINTNQG